MKDMKIKMLTSVMLIIGLSTFMSCEKEQESLSNTVIKTEDQIVVNQIMDFLDKVELERQGVTQKNNEFMSIDSAIWYIEAAINYTATEPLSSSDSEISFYTVDVLAEDSHGMLEMSEIQVVYDSFQSYIDDIISLDDNINKIFIADIFVKETKSTNSTLSMAIGVEKSLMVYPPVLHDWYWGGGLGRCDGSGLGVGTDAADIINNRINQTIIMPPAGAFWTDVDYFTMVGASDGLFQYCDPVPTNHCLSSQEITDYIGVVESYTNNHCPSGKQLIYRNFYDDIIPSMPNYEGLHICEIRFGILRYGIEL